MEGVGLFCCFFSSRRRHTRSLRDWSSDVCSSEQISGLIERVTFHSDESGFCVLRVKIKGQRDDVTVVGSLPTVTAGEWLVADGWWVRDKEHGLQFKATTLKT